MDVHGLRVKGPRVVRGFWSLSGCLERGPELLTMVWGRV